MKIEIKHNRITLPFDEQKITFLPLSPEEWKEGEYIADEEMFWVNDEEYYYARDVVFWEPLDGNYPAPDLDIVTPEWIRQRRKEKGLTLEELGKLTGTTKNMVSAWESDSEHSRNPRGPAKAALWYALQ
jgi:hypothetical protein